MSEDCHESGKDFAWVYESYLKAMAERQRQAEVNETPLHGFDALYRDYVLKNVARTIRQEFMEEAVRQLEIAELNRVWEESK